MILTVTLVFAEKIQELRESRISKLVRINIMESLSQIRAEHKHRIRSQTSEGS